MVKKYSKVTRFCLTLKKKTLFFGCPFSIFSDFFMFFVGFKKKKAIKNRWRTDIFRWRKLKNFQKCAFKKKKPSECQQRQQRENSKYMTRE